MPWCGAPGLAVDVIPQVYGLDVDHIDVFGGRDGEVVGEDGDLVAVDLDGVVLVEDALLLGELGGHSWDGW